MFSEPHIVDLLGASSSDSDTNSDPPMPAYEFYIPGNPTPLPRSRFFRGGFFNHSRQAMRDFGLNVRRNLSLTGPGVLFDRQKPVTVTIWFYLKRPATDFVGRQRCPGNLRNESLQCPVLPIGPDIDNLAKFVLDAMNGIVYHDDRQVVRLQLYKVRDNLQYCLGGTFVEIKEYDPRADAAIVVL